MGPTHEKCLHEDRWDQVRADLAEIKTGLADLNRRLFIGNGQPALAHCVATHTRILTWIGGVLGVVATGGVVWAVRAFVLITLAR